MSLIQLVQEGPGPTWSWEKGLVLLPQTLTPVFKWEKGGGDGLLAAGTAGMQGRKREVRKQGPEGLAQGPARAEWVGGDGSGLAGVASLQDSNCQNRI